MDIHAWSRLEFGDSECRRLVRDVVVCRVLAVFPVIVVPIVALGDELEESLA